MEELIIDYKRFRPTNIQNYWVSEFGDIINLNTNKYLIPFITNDGHKRIELKIRKGVPKKFFIHRLVYEAFVGPLLEGYVIEHLDSNPLNNHYTNLKQSTQKENVKTAIDFGTFGKSHCKEIIIMDKINNNGFLKFGSIKDCINFIGLYGDSKGRLLRSSTFTNKYDIIDNIESQSTIETINFNNHEVYNGVEYDRGAIPLVTINI